MFENRNVAYLNAKEETAFLSSVQALNSPKYYLLALLMVDCGLRVSEAISLRMKDFNFQKPTVFVTSLKKRKKTGAVELPLTKRIVNAAADLWVTMKRRPEPDEYMFNGGNATEGKHIHRATVFKVFKSFDVNPHKLRHTCATKLIESGTPLLVVKDLLRHSDSRVTEVYIHTSEERKLAAIKSIEKESVFASIRERLFPSKKVHVLPVAIGNTKYHVGREKEMSKLTELHEKRINVILLGRQGIGKSHILDNFKTPKMLRIDDCAEFKKTLANMVVHLAENECKDKIELMQIDTDVITKGSVKRSVELLKQLTEEREYTIVIDDCSRLTPPSIKILEELRSHFHMIVAARSVPISSASWLTNFEKINIEPLKRAEATELIKLSCADFKNQIEDVEAFKNHVYESTCGVPLAIHEMCQRYRVEKFVRAEDIQAIVHSGAKNGKSFVPILLMLLGCIVVGKFYAKEAMQDDKEAFMIFGAGAMILLMFGRSIFAATKRRFV
jgi:integrase/recombinase XerD